MRCDEFERRIQSLLDARAIPSESADLKSHALDCPHCHRLLAIEAHLFDALEEVQAVAPPEGFAERIVETHVTSLPQRTRPRFGSFTRWAIAVAAASLLCVVWYRGTPPAPTPPTPRTFAVPEPPREVALPSGSPSEKRSRGLNELIDPAHVAQRIKAAAGDRLADVDDVAVAVASLSSPWARPITTAFAAIQQNLPFSIDWNPEDGPKQDGTNQQDDSTARQIVPN